MYIGYLLCYNKSIRKHRNRLTISRNKRISTMQNLIKKRIVTSGQCAETAFSIVYTKNEFSVTVEKLLCGKFIFNGIESSTLQHLEATQVFPYLQRLTAIQKLNYLVKKYDLVHIDTGGNCTAYQMDMPRQTYQMNIPRQASRLGHTITYICSLVFQITDSSGLNKPETADEQVLVTLRRKDDVEIMHETFDNIAQFIDIVYNNENNENNENKED